MSYIIDVNEDYGYGQYEDIDIYTREDYNDVKKDQTLKYDELQSYNEYLDRCEQMLDYTNPSQHHITLRYATPLYFILQLITRWFIK
jgi:hypothetical protein